MLCIVVVSLQLLFVVCGVAVVVVVVVVVIVGLLSLLSLLSGCVFMP